MRILIFGVEFECSDFECKYVFDEEKFFNEILFKHYEVLIINFDFLSSFLEVNKFFKGMVIFIYTFADRLIYKRALEVGDYFYTFEETWEIPYRLRYISKKILNRKSDIFVFNDLVFNLKTKELYKNRVNIKLSPAERDVLKLLIENKNRFLSKEFIVENSENIDNISSIKVIISNLRKTGFEIDNQKNLGYKIKIKE